MNYPNRNCRRGSNRLHRTASVRHSESIESNSQSQDGPQAASHRQAGMRPESPASESLSALLADLSSEEGSGIVDPTPCPGGQQPHPPESSSPVRAMLDNDSSVPDLPTPTILVPATPYQHNQPASAGDNMSRLRGLRERLEASTALVRNLQTRNTIQEADNARLRLSYQKDELIGKVLKVVLGVLLVCVVVYGVAGWCNGPEMEYVRMRRRAVLGM